MAGWVVMLLAGLVVALAGGAAQAQIGCTQVAVPPGADAVAFEGYKCQCLFIEAVTGQAARLETTGEAGVTAQVEGAPGYVSYVKPTLDFTVKANRVVIRLTPNPVDRNCVLFTGRVTLAGGGPAYSRRDLAMIAQGVRTTMSQQPGTFVSDDAWTPDLEAAAGRMLASAGLPDTVRGQDLVLVARLAELATMTASVKDGDARAWPKYFAEKARGQARIEALLSGRPLPAGDAVAPPPPPEPDAGLAADLRAATGLTLRTDTHPFFPERQRPLITAVDAGSAASAVNLRAGARVVDIDGTRVSTADDVARALIAARGRTALVRTAGDCADIAHPMAVPAPGASAAAVDQLPRVLFPMAQDPAFVAIWRNDHGGVGPLDLRESAFRILEAISNDARRCLPTDAAAVPVQFTFTTTRRNGLGQILSQDTGTRDEVMRVAPAFEAFVRANVALARDSTAPSPTRRAVAELAGLGGCEGADLQRLLRGVAMVAGAAAPAAPQATPAAGDLAATRDWRAFAQACYGDLLSVAPNISPAIAAHICICTEEALAAGGDAALYAAAQQSYATMWGALDDAGRAALDTATRAVCPTPETPLNGTRDDVADRYRTFAREAGL